jgi:TRAP-type C4-dicarboxylate transport system substrate-binding protein
VQAVLLVCGTAAAEPGDPVRLRVGTLAIDGSRYMRDIVALGQAIEKRTRGGVVIDWVSGGQLGDETAMARLIAGGKLDGGGFGDTGLTALVPELVAFGEPGRFRTYEEVERVTTALAPTVRELFGARDLVFAMWADLGFARLFSADPIAHLADVLPPEAHGVRVLPPLYMLAMGTANVRAMTNLRYRYVIGGLVFAHAAFAKLTAAQQLAVLEVCRAWEPRIRASWRKETEAGIAALDKAGVQTYAVTRAEAEAFIGATPVPPPGSLGAKIVGAL